jgi:hypothetical protein
MFPYNFNLYLELKQLFTNMDRIVSLSNLSVDLERVRAIKIEESKEKEGVYLLVVEYNKRIEFDVNPFTDEVVKLEIEDRISAEQFNYEWAQEGKQQLAEGWNDYLKEQKANEKAK